MDGEQWDFAQMLSKPYAHVKLEDLLWDFAVLVDPWEKQNAMKNPPDEFIAVRWIDMEVEYYAGRSVHLRGCPPKVAQIWAGEGKYPFKESYVRCLFFDDPEYSDYYKEQKEEFPGEALFPSFHEEFDQNPG